MKQQRIVAILAVALAGVVLTARPGGAQTVFDQMKCYKIRDAAKGKSYSIDLIPELTHDFQTEIGDRIVGGFLQKGCRIKVPAKYFCIQSNAQQVHDVLPPYTAAQWNVPGADAGERLCYKLTCPAVAPKSIPIIDPFGNRTIELLGRTEYLCGPVERQPDTTTDCEMAGNGQCGGICPSGQKCLATSTQGCGCVPLDEECASSSVCAVGLCTGVWETCVSFPGAGCGCSHP
jgi:hypothetical protein